MKVQIVIKKFVYTSICRNSKLLYYKFKFLHLGRFHFYKNRSFKYPKSIKNYFAVKENQVSAVKR